MPPSLIVPFDFSAPPAPVLARAFFDASPAKNMTDLSLSPQPDFYMGEGDSLPARSAILTLDNDPIDLTNHTATMMVARDDLSAPVVVMSVTIDPDQVANKGKVTWKFFNVGVARRGLYDAKMKVLDGSGEQISFDADRMLYVLVTPDPGPG